MGRRNVFDVIKNGEVPPVKGLVQLAHAYDLAQYQSDSQRLQDRLK